MQRTATGRAGTCEHGCLQKKKYIYIIINTVNKLLIIFFLFQHSKPAISRTASLIAWWTNILIAQLHLRIVMSRLTQVDIL